MGKLAICVAAAAALAPSGAARAAEIFAGVYVHDVDTVFSKAGYEQGADIQLGWRGERIAEFRAIGAPSPHAFLSLNSDGGTDYAVAGLGWRLGGRVYVRPGIGLAVHTGPELRVRDGRRVDLGSRIVFAPELALGYQATERISVEASWVHLSHGQLFGRQNAGMDNIGLRLNYRFR